MERLRALGLYPPQIAAAGSDGRTVVAHDQFVGRLQEPAVAGHEKRGVSVLIPSGSSRYSQRGFTTEKSCAAAPAVEQSSASRRIVHFFIVRFSFKD